MKEDITIGNRIISTKSPVLIIAEAGVNHNGDIELAKKLIDAGAEAGVDAVKFQRFTAEGLVTKTAEQAEYQVENTGKKESQYDMLKRLELAEGDYPILKEYCKEKGLLFLCTAFAIEDVEFLEKLGVDWYKIPSGEITNLPYIRHIAKKRKPIIISTGMSTMEEVKTALKTIKAEGNEQIICLHCTSSYPASPESLNLQVIKTMQKELDVFIGYSDHSKGDMADVITTTLGVRVIEKHFTLDNNMEGPDHMASLGPHELKKMVDEIRTAEVMLGSNEKKLTEVERSVRDVTRKSIIIKHDMKAGETIGSDDLAVKRPGNGIPPYEIDNILGKKLVRDISADTLLQRKDYG